MDDRRSRAAPPPWVLCLSWLVLRGAVVEQAARDARAQRRDGEQDKKRKSVGTTCPAVRDGDPTPPPRYGGEPLPVPHEDSEQGSSKTNAVEKANVRGNVCGTHEGIAAADGEMERLRARHAKLVDDYSALYAEHAATQRRLQQVEDRLKQFENVRSRNTSTY